MQQSDEVFYNDLLQVEANFKEDASQKGYDVTKTSTWMLLQALLRNLERRVLAGIDRPARDLRRGLVSDEHGEASTFDSTQE